MINFFDLFRSEAVFGNVVNIVLIPIWFKRRA
jgi:hypothetical protein